MSNTFVKLSAITTELNLTGWLIGNDGWFFANNVYQPSYWLMLKREGFCADLLQSAQQTDYVLHRFKRQQLVDIYQLHFFYRQQPSEHHSIDSLRNQVKRLIFSGQINVFKIDGNSDRGGGRYQRLLEPTDYVAHSALNAAIGFSSAVADRHQQLAEQLGHDVVKRWSTEDRADITRWDHWFLWQELIDAYRTQAKQIDTSLDTIPALWELGVLAVTVAGETLKLRLKLRAKVINLASKAVSTDFDGIKQDLSQAGIVFDQQVNDVKTLIKKIQEGYDMFILLKTHKQTNTLLADYFQSLIQCVIYRQSKTVNNETVFEVGLEVLIALATAGVANKTRSVGPFSSQAIELMAQLASALKAKTLPLTKPQDKLTATPPLSATKRSG